MNKKKWYVFDFETRGEDFYKRKGYTEIYLWDACEMGKDYKHTHGFDGKSFIDFLQEKEANGYFHNLAFDMEFLLYMLDEAGFTSVTDIEDMKPKTYYINRQGMQIYRLTICFREKITKKGNKKSKKRILVNIFDSLKLLPFKVKEIGKAYGLGIEKQFDKDYYDVEKDENYVITEKDIKGCEADTEIVARALDKIQENGVHKQTLASSAFGTFKEMLKDNGLNFKELCPPLQFDVDNYLRNGYFGGYCYYNKKYKEKELKNVYIYDVNSLYAYSYTNTLLPVGVPVYFVGEYQIDKEYPLYVQRFRANFSLKENSVPTIQKNKTSIRTNTPEYLESSEDMLLDLTLTNIDLELFKQNYNIYDIEYLDGYKFRARDDLFTDFTKKYIEQKMIAGQIGNKVLRQTAKNNLNMCYGKPATSLIAEKYKVIKDENGLLKQKLVGQEIVDGIYLPLSMFITAYARQYVINAIRDNIDSFIYCDTDSMHLTKPAKNIKIDYDDTGNLGEWKIEHKCVRYKFLQPKRYIYLEKDKKVVKCSGMTEDSQSEFIAHNTFDEMVEQFKNGYEFINLKKKNVKGGCILCKVDTKLKERK